MNKKLGMDEKPTNVFLTNVTYMFDEICISKSWIVKSIMKIWKGMKPGWYKDSHVTVTG